MAKLSRQGQLLWSTYLGGSGPDHGDGIAVDGAGNAYVTGYTRSRNLPLLHALQPRYGGNRGPSYVLGDAFVVKLSPQGQLLYSTYLGGSGLEEGTAIAADGAGNAYVTGTTTSLDFPTLHALQPHYGGQRDPSSDSGDAFVARLSSQGQLLYSTYLGGRSDDAASGIAADGGGNAYVTGSTGSHDFPTLHAFQPRHIGNPYRDDAFVAGIGPDGQLLYSTHFGGTSGAGTAAIAADSAETAAIAADSAGNAYITGATGPRLPILHALQARYGGGDSDVFVLRLSPQGQPLFATYLGGTLADAGDSIALDAVDNVYITGTTTSADFPTHHAWQSKADATYNYVFVTSLSAGQ